MITGIDYFGCVSIASAATLNTASYYPDSTSITNVVAHDPFLSGVAGETLFHHTLEFKSPANPGVNYEDLFVEIKKSDGSYAEVPILERAFLGSVQFNFQDPNRFVQYQARVYGFDEYPTDEYEIVRVPRNYLQPGPTQFLSWSQIVAILQNALSGKK